MIKTEKEKLGAILKEARKAHGFTQAEVAKKLGVTFQAISNYERGTNYIDDEILAQLCELYDIPFQRTIDSIDYQEIAEKLKKARTAKKITQAKVSELSGFSVSEIRNYESGKVEIPWDSMYVLCGIYDIPICSLVEKRKLYFRFTNYSVFMNINDNFRELANNLRKVADDVENLLINEPDNLREISVTFKLDITERL